MSEEEELWQNRIVSWNGSLCPSPCGAAFWGRHEGSVALLLGLWEGWLGCSSAASCRWMFLLEMGFAGLPSSFPYPEAVASGWLGGRAWEYGRGFVLGSAFGSPNPLKSSFSIPDLLGFWPHFLPHPDIWQSAGPLFSASEWLLMGRWFLLGQFRKSGQTQQG